MAFKNILRLSCALTTTKIVFDNKFVIHSHIVPSRYEKTEENIILAIQSGNISKLNHIVNQDNRDIDYSKLLAKHFNSHFDTNKTAEIFIELIKKDNDVFPRRHYLICNEKIFDYALKNNLINDEFRNSNWFLGLLHAWETNQITEEYFMKVLYVLKDKGFFHTNGKIGYTHEHIDTLCNAVKDDRKFSKILDFFFELDKKSVYSYDKFTDRKSAKILEYKLNHGFDPTQKNSLGQNLMFTVLLKKISLKDVDDKGDDQNQNSLSICGMFKNSLDNLNDCIKFLHSRGIQIQDAGLDNNGRTPAEYIEYFNQNYSAASYECEPPFPAPKDFGSCIF